MINVVPVLMTLQLQAIDPQGFTIMTMEDGLPENDVRVVYEDDAGAIWFGTRNSGVARWLANEWVYYTEADGLAANGVLDLLETTDGTLWAVGGRGYSQFDGEDWKPAHTVDSSRPNVVYDVFQANGSDEIWIGFNGGAARLVGSEWRAVTPADGLPHPVVHNVWADGIRTVWFACRRGLARLVGDRLTVYYRDENFRSILEGPDGGLWFGTAGDGALQWVNGEWRRHLPGANVHPVLLDERGVLWAKSDGEGVYAYADDEWRQLSTANGFPSDTVHGIHDAADGTLWFATSSGAVHMRMN